MKSAYPLEVDKAIAEIARDNRSGASVLFREALKIFPLLSQSLPTEKSLLTEILKQSAAKLRSAQPQMAPFVHLALYLENLAQKRLRTDILQNALLAFPIAAERKVRKHHRRIVEIALENFANSRRILVHSRSSLVEAFLLEWLAQDRSHEAWITESRPMREGAALAIALESLPGKTVLLVDDARSLALHEVDAALIGADRVSERAVRNKIGSLSLALGARRMNKPIFVLAEMIKFLPETYETAREVLRPRREILTGHKNIQAYNYYFEEVPLDLVRGVITPKGILQQAEIAEVFRQGAWEILSKEGAT